MEESLLLTIFQYAAMCPLPIFNACPYQHRVGGGGTRNYTKQRVHSRLLIMWSLVMIICNGIIYFVVIAKYQTKILKPKSNFSRLSDIANLSAIYLTHLIIVIEAIWTRNDLCSFLIKLRQVNTDIRDLFLDPKKSQVPPLDYYLRKFITYLLFACIIELIIILRIQNNQQWSIYWYVCVIPLMMGRMRHLQHAFFIDIITIRFKLMRKEIQQLIKYSMDKKQYKIDDSYLMDKIRIIKSAYSNLYEMSINLNALLGVSQLVNLMQNFIQLTSDFFFIYSVLYRNDFTYLIGKYL